MTGISDKKEIPRAIELVELQKDLADLQKQSLVIAGAIQYISQKIAKLSQPEEEVKKDTPI